MMLSKSFCSWFFCFLISVFLLIKNDEKSIKCFVACLLVFQNSDECVLLLLPWITSPKSFSITHIATVMHMTTEYIYFKFLRLLCRWARSAFEFRFSRISMVQVGSSATTNYWNRYIYEFLRQSLTRVTWSFSSNLLQR